MAMNLSNDHTNLPKSNIARQLVFSTPSRKLVIDHAPQQW